LIAGDLLDTPQRLTVVGSPIMGNVSILWMDLLKKKDPDFGGIHVGQPTDPEVFNLRHGHVDAIFLNRKLLDRDIKVLDEHAGKIVELNVGESVKNGYQVYMYFWDDEGKIDPLIEQFLEAAVSDAGLAISDGENKYLRVHTDKIRAYLAARKQKSEQGVPPNGP
jgi:hypothetical protein